MTEQTINQEQTTKINWIDLIDSDSEEGIQDQTLEDDNQMQSLEKNQFQYSKLNKNSPTPSISTECSISQKTSMNKRVRRQNKMKFVINHSLNWLAQQIAQNQSEYDYIYINIYDLSETTSIDELKEHFKLEKTNAIAVIPHRNIKGNFDLKFKSKSQAINFILCQDHVFQNKRYNARMSTRSSKTEKQKTINKLTQEYRNEKKLEFLKKRQEKKKHQCSKEQDLIEENQNHKQNQQPKRIYTFK